jgi:hypothetical protein
MEESIWRHQTGGISISSLDLAQDDTLELGSFIAALCEETEDEFDVDLRVRAFLESVWLRRVAAFASFAAFAQTPLPEASILEN